MGLQDLAVLAYTQGCDFCPGERHEKDPEKARPILFEGGNRDEVALD